jgi:6-phosphogluconate dehydrogenase
MHIGLVGLGRMGSNMRTRLRDHDITVTGFDTNPDITDVPTLEDLITVLPKPRIVWVMVPSGDITHSVVTRLVGRPRH